MKVGVILALHPHLCNNEYRFSEQAWLSAISVSTHVYFFKHSGMLISKTWNKLALALSRDSNHEPAGD